MVWQTALTLIVIGVLGIVMRFFLRCMDTFGAWTAALDRCTDALLRTHQSQELTGISQRVLTRRLEILEAKHEAQEKRA